MTDRIVVGIDGSPGSYRALEWAVEEAARTGAIVEAIHVWHMPFVDAFAYTSSALNPTDVESGARALAQEAVAPFHGDAPIEVRVLCGSPASVLVHEAKGAAMLVVGSRGRGGFAGLLLGSVSQQVSHHAPCPVVIVPSVE